MFELAEEVVEQSSNLLSARFVDVEGGYELTCGWPLVQAAGKCCGVDFYFRAARGEWEFEAEDPQGHPFPEGDARRFVRRGRYDEDKPAAMGIEWAARILRRCLAEGWGLRR